jgi:hypothetical protein
MAHALRLNHVLTRLDLTGCPVGDAGVEALAQVHDC